ncbi:PREDICTED: uncharacterized protein LOC105569666 isoform X2 [Vollenhovia emeryi]|uniref:uncharacterized protein LOC105569666 isoform X2 n=1 Tax=Vollenhovia emeryi TaxID=411798 RepID=UPI0005F532BE|nr:PREDICTED: uncharacterized protein LOC105569666 isoform X2 [Vollenhovia emeryi]
MEKKGLRKKDMLRMDGLLPPTRRLPVCDAVTSASEKKKDRKWSLGGILRRISSIKDYESSSNDEEIVYCKKSPKKPSKFRHVDGVVLHSVKSDASERDKKRTRVESNVRHVTDSPRSRRDSLHSRSSDGSLDGLGRKSRRNKLKARAEAKRDHLCAGSSSDEDSRRSNGSLNRSHVADGPRGGNACSKRTRAARTERYIKRLSRDEGNGSGDALSDPHGKRCSTDLLIEDKERAVCPDVNGLCRPPIHPRRSTVHPADSSGRAFPGQRSSAESLPYPEVYDDARRYSAGQYTADLNENSAYGKISRHISGDVYADGRSAAGNFFTYPAYHHSEVPFDRAVGGRSVNPNNQPPEPPPRDPRYRAFGYGYSSYPLNRHQNVPNYLKQENNRISAASGATRPDWRNFRLYGSSNEIARRDATDREPNPKAAEFRNSLERINNKYNSSRHCANESAYREMEATRRRNIRNDQLSRNDANYRAYEAKNKSADSREASKRHETISSHASTPDRSSGRSPCEQRVSRTIVPSTRDVNNRANEGGTSEEALERRRSSRNLEEALSELEAIYNSLRLGDEELLDRAERRSMEEFSQRRGGNEADAFAAAADSPDRTRDDMAYRRMHPKERPASLSDVAGQSTLSSISYLIASPVLSRRDSADDLVRLPAAYPSRRDEPDVTRDDVLFRSISHANNTLRVIEPQPPFGIPLGPVTAATESDYLHTTPTKSEQPRSPYIPQCEPDVVTDDLAYRALRKDAVAATARNVAEPSQAVTRGTKKRAVRSLSANLYGLINHERIHLRREPSLDAIRDEIQDVARNFAAVPERAEYLRRVVSDGELSDNDAHRWKELAVKGDIDINGNHPAANSGGDGDGAETDLTAYTRLCQDLVNLIKSDDDATPPNRNKLRAHVSSEMTTATGARGSPNKEKESGVAELSDAMLSSKAILNDGFWHEYLHSDSNVAAANSGGDGDGAETDLTAYTRLCQDLVNLIKSDDDATSPNADDSVAADKSNSDVGYKVDESPASVRTRSLGSQHSGPRRANDERNMESEGRSPASQSDGAETDLTAYTRLCQDLVNLITSDDDATSPNADDSVAADKSNSDVGYEVEEPPASVRTRSLGSQHSGPRRANDERNMESEGRSPASQSDSNSARSWSDATPAATSSNLDFYLRVADENVKLMAEAFGDVADRLRDSQLSARKGSPAASRSSSTPYSQDEPTSDDRPLVTPRLEEMVARAASKRDSLTSNDGDQGAGNKADRLEVDASTIDAELDLSRAVRDLQLAAASLYEHEREIEALGTGRGGLVRDADEGAEDAAAIRKVGLRRKRGRDQEEGREGLQTLARPQVTIVSEMRSSPT